MPVDGKNRDAVVSAIRCVDDATGGRDGNLGASVVGRVARWDRRQDLDRLQGAPLRADRMQEAYTEYGRVVESGSYTGLTSDQAIPKMAADAKAKAADKRVAAVTDEAVTEAEGETKIALAKCDALQGDAQQQCRDQANSHLQSVKDRAKAAKKGPLEQ